MRLTCPHCRHAIELVPDETPGESVSCPSCGSKLPGFEETVALRPRASKTVAHFELIQHVGRGHFGDVWKARDTQLGRVVALKLPRTQDFDDEATRVFMREARAAANLDHANIVTVFEVGQDEGTIYIVSRFVAGVTLAELIAEKRLPAREAAELCATVAEALHHAHEKGVVHRDLKPRNIMIDMQNRPYVMDFGLAKQDASEISMTATGEVLGTPAYMPPEQARGESRAADRRADVYSLGVVLYELMAKRRPFHGSSRMLMRQILVDEPVPPSKHDRSVPRDLETICLKAMAKEPARRYQTAGEMAEDLRRYLSGEPIQARRATAVERGWRWARRKPVAAAALALGALAFVLLVTMILSAWKNRQLQELAAANLKTVFLETNPPGARVVFHPLHPITFEPRPDRAIRPSGVSPVRVKLAPGDYLVVAVPDRPGYSFHEVFRRVPRAQGAEYHAFRHLSCKADSGGVIELPAIELPKTSVTDGMARFDGATEFDMGSRLLTEAPWHTRAVPSFFLDTSEVTIGEYRTFNDGRVPPHSPDQSVRDASPLTYVTWDWAASFAETAGKRLPTETEFEFAATLGGTREFPWGDDAEQMTEWTVSETSPVDVLPTSPPVRGLSSGPAEWTCSGATFYPIFRRQGFIEPEEWSVERIVRGGTLSVINGKPDPEEWRRGPRTRTMVVKQWARPGLGFRCARSAKPRLDPEDFDHLVPPAKTVASRGK